MLVCALGPDRVWGNLRDKTLLLAVITPFKTRGEDASTTLTHYKNTGTLLVTDIRNVKALVGRVETRGRWGLIDRSVGLAQAMFVVDEDISSDSDW